MYSCSICVVICSTINSLQSLSQIIFISSASPAASEMCIYTNDNFMVESLALAEEGDSKSDEAEDEKK